jgi:hypothetical protein
VALYSVTKTVNLIYQEYPDKHTVLGHLKGNQGGGLESLRRVVADF